VREDLYLVQYLFQLLLAEGYSERTSFDTWLHCETIAANGVARFGVLACACDVACVWVGCASWLRTSLAAHETCRVTFERWGLSSRP